jgi:MFS family permease
MAQERTSEVGGKIDYRLVAPIVVNSLLIHIVVSLVRVTTSYRAVELELPVVWIGAIAAAFALFPIFLAVWVGRFIDRGNDAVAVWIGSGLITLSCAGFALFPSAVALLFPSAVALLVFTALAGTGHLFMHSANQLLCVRAGGESNMDRVFGNYMLAAALGQGLGPFVVGWLGGSAMVPPTGLLFTLGFALSAITFVVALAIPRSREAAGKKKGGEVMPLTALLRLPGVKAVIAAGIFISTAQDLIVIYLPVLGAERAIEAEVIGILLAVRAGFSMVARVFYARMVEAFGREPLMVACTFVAALAFLLLAAPLPLWAMHVTVAIMGFMIGTAALLSVTTVIDRTPKPARGTANSLRVVGNRIGQVALPFGAGLIAAATGVAGILVAIAVTLAASAATVQLSRPARKAADV